MDLGAPRSIRRGHKRLVRLIDLWVATLLPGDFLDLRFELVLSDAGGRVQRSAPLDALRFARGSVTRPGRALYWEEEAATQPKDSPGGALGGLRLDGVRVHAAATPALRLVVPAAPAPRDLLPTRSMDLRRLLPNALGYPEVEWRSARG